MSSFVYITLDTRPPEIEIFAPSYTTTDMVTIIRIETNEKVSDFQEIYVVDSNGVRHDYTFNKVEDNLIIGEVSFFNFPFGITTVYVSLMDKVGNKSSLVNKSIVIRENSTLLNLKINDRIRDSYIKVSDCLNSIKEYSKEVDVSDHDVNTVIDDNKRNIEIVESIREVS